MICFSGQPMDMQIELVRAFTGVNVYSHHPVVMMKLDLEELEGKNSGEISGFTARLLQLLPALEAFEYTGAPVVVKPLDGRQGKGVSLDLKTSEEVVRAFRIAQEYSRKVLAEEQLEGKNYRVLIVDGVMVAASERVPCGVIGDGAHSLAELVEIENHNPMRGEGHAKPLTKIKIDSIVLTALDKSGWKMEDAPNSGESVSLCAGMNLSTGETARDVTDEVHPGVKLMCERAARLPTIRFVKIMSAINEKEKSYAPICKELNSMPPFLKNFSRSLIRIAADRNL